MSGSEDGKLCVWDLVDGQVMHKMRGGFDMPEDCSLLNVNFRDENMLVCGCSDGGIRVCEKSVKIGC